MTLDHLVEGPETSPVLVLSSSLGTTFALWDEQLPDLVGRFQVLRYDHPGHGRSAPASTPATIEGLAAGVVELLDSLSLERVSFCGLSLGGMVGMALALHAPERVERLVLASSAAYLGPPENWHERARLVRAEGLDAIADSVLRRWFTDGFRANRPHATARFRAMLTATSPDGYAACCEAIAGWDARHDVHAIASPTLVLAGAEDPATTSEHAQLLAREIRGARLVTLQGAAHLANVEQPDAFTEALLAHLVAAPGTMEAA